MIKTLRQVKRAPGFQHGALLADRKWTFWTMTAWSTQEDMRHYMTSGAHKAVMPRLMDWCDEASVAHWSQREDALPAWPEADARMRSTGRISKVRHASAQHAGLSYDVPRTTRAGTIQPAR